MTHVSSTAPQPLRRRKNLICSLQGRGRLTNDEVNRADALGIVAVFLLCLRKELQTKPRSIKHASCQKLRMVPVVWIEQTTYRLQGGCSTTELNGLSGIVCRSYSHCPAVSVQFVVPEALNRTYDERHCDFGIFIVSSNGFGTDQRPYLRRL
jgi:hypothetical protein